MQLCHQFFPLAEEIFHPMNGMSEMFKMLSGASVHS